MKKINKLQINSDRLMKNEELITLKGGYDGPCCYCKAWNGITIGVIYGSTPYNCNSDCFYSLGTGYGVWECLV